MLNMHMYYLVVQTSPDLSPALVQSPRMVLDLRSLSLVSQ